MDVYKLGKSIKNQVIDIHISLEQLNEVRDSLRSSLKRRKEISIAENDRHYKEIDTTKLFIVMKGAPLNTINSQLKSQKQ